MMLCRRRWLNWLSAHQSLLSASSFATKAASATTKPPKNASTMEVELEESVNPFFLMRTVGSSHRRWQAALDKHPELKQVKRKDLAKTAETLKAFNYNAEEIISKPMVLYTNAKTLTNRHSVLSECGIDLITLSLLFKYVTVMNKTVTALKSYGHIPFDTNVIERLTARFTDLEVKITDDSACNENMEIKEVRQRILNCYLRQRLDMTQANIDKLWKVYSRVRHKSFHSVQAIIEILLTELRFSKERITKNAYLLHADADNVNRILANIPTIDGQDIREIVYRRPKILMSSCDSLVRSLEHVKAYGIGEDAVMRCLEVLTLGPDTVLERLRDLNEIEQFQVLGSNPRVLRLVHYQNKARLRLEYLNQLKVRCASLHILSCGSVAFAKFARDGSDRTKGRDIVVYLANYMEKDEHEIRNLLARHPNWCHIPLVNVKQCLDFLLKKKFKLPDIYSNIHLLLYPVKRIEEKILQIQSPEFFEDSQLLRRKHLSAREILTLVLYFIECEFHFTGDGIWTEQHTQTVENFNNLLPDFPESLNKIYKYGMKAPNEASAETSVPA